MSPRERAAACLAAIELYQDGVVPAEDLRTDAPTRVALDRAWSLVRRRTQRPAAPLPEFLEEVL